MNDSKGTRILAVGCFLAAFALLGAPSGAIAQEATGMLAGTVTMVETGEPLEGVEVRLGETGRTAVTDENGEFLFMG
ncbi:MAG: hypothetical protein R3199_11355, partial [Gemmatimonadota bacterium]|nr:hypothetical protein [Gemmatimonadota bacterium]